jgi:4-hydroxy-tetrahydrodipicolinate synthase
MENTPFSGTGVALVTPFRDDGSIDVEDLRKHVEFQIENGVRVMVPGGTTGEGVTLSADEHQLLIRTTVEATQGRVPVLAGAGGSDTADVVRKARAAREAGADGILSVSPAYNKPTQRGLIEHYRAVAGAVDCPVIIYNVPGRTASNVLPETILALAEIENIAGVKEASGDVDQVMTLIRERPQGFTILSGDDALTFPLLAAGADGVISVVANLAPALMSQMVERALSGDYEGARKLHYRLLPLMRAIFVETNPIPVKAALEIMGHRQAHFRLPLVRPTAEVEAFLRRALADAGLLETEGPT